MALPDLEDGNPLLGVLDEETKDLLSWLGLADRVPKGEDCLLEGLAAAPGDLGSSLLRIVLFTEDLLPCRDGRLLTGDPAVLCWSLSDFLGGVVNFLEGVLGCLLDWSMVIYAAKKVLDGPE